MAVGTRNLFALASASKAPMTRRVIAMAGKDNAWLLVGLLSLAVWALAGDFASAQAPDWETYMEAATKAYREGRYAEAEKQLKAALKEAEDFRPEDPRVAQILNNLARLYRAQGKRRGSRTALQALVGDPGEGSGGGEGRAAVQARFHGSPDRLCG